MHCLFYDYVVAISVFRNWVEKTEEEKNKIIDPYLLISHHLEAVLQSRVRALNFPFLGPRGPLRTPLMSVRPSGRPSSATFSHATSHYSFSDSKLILFLFQTLSSRNLSHSTQYTEHWTWTLNIENSQTFLAQFDLVSCVIHSDTVTVCICESLGPELDVYRNIYWKIGFNGTEGGKFMNWNKIRMVVSHQSSANG